MRVTETRKISTVWIVNLPGLRMVKNLILQQWIRRLFQEVTGIIRDGEFDNSCIYASSPVTDGQKVWIYYMGGNGQHTNFRESSLGRAYWEADKFACWTEKNEGMESILTTTTLTVSGNLYRSAGR